MQWTDTGAYVLRSSVKEVLLYCAVFDSKGSLVTDLQQSAFRVSENKVAAPIVKFSREDIPVSLNLILDDSGSMKGKRASVQSAAITLMEGSNPEDETAVTNFADASYLDQDFTVDFQKLDVAVTQSKTVSGGTALFDTLIAGADHLTDAGQHRKQVIVVITDGHDNASAVDLQAAIRRVQAVNGPVIYSIGLLFDLPNHEARRARHDLEALCDQTGGMAFFPGSAADVDKVAAEVARDIRNQYTVSYRPPDDAAAGSYRSIAVQAVARDYGKLTVRTRKGYVRTATVTSEGILRQSR